MSLQNGPKTVNLVNAVTMLISDETSEGISGNHCHGLIWMRHQPSANGLYDVPPGFESNAQRKRAKLN